jgi:hypothetical protein
MDSGRPQRGDEAHANAVERLDDARDHEDLMRGAADAARGTSSEDAADERLREAGNRVAAREAWLTWLERGF